MTVDVDKNILKIINEMKPEECGFIYGDGVFDKIKLIKNVSNNKDEFIMSKLAAFFFLIYLGFKGYNFGVFHVHKYRPFPSNSDKRNMMSGLLYFIGYKSLLYCYKKKNIEIYNIKCNYV